MRELRGRVVLVTGATRGIGRRVAEQLAPLGAKLCITGRTTTDLESLADKLRTHGTEVEAVPADLTNPTDRERLVANCVERFGGLDVLMNIAGVASLGEFATSKPEILRQVMEINFFAPVELLRVCLPYLKKSVAPGWRPAVLNLASICGRCGIPSLSEHSGSKHALVGFSDAFRAEIHRHGIDVLVVLPGAVRSDDMNRHMLRFEPRIHVDHSRGQTPDEVAARVIDCLIRNRVEATSGSAAFWARFGMRFGPRIVRLVMRRKVERYARRHPE